MRLEVYRIKHSVTCQYFHQNLYDQAGVWAGEEYATLWTKRGMADTVLYTLRKQRTPVTLEISFIDARAMKWAPVITKDRSRGTN